MDIKGDVHFCLRAIRDKEGKREGEILSILLKNR